MILADCDFQEIVTIVGLFFYAELHRGHRVVELIK